MKSFKSKARDLAREVGYEKDAAKCADVVRQLEVNDFKKATIAIDACGLFFYTDAATVKDSVRTYADQTESPAKREAARSVLLAYFRQKAHYHSDRAYQMYRQRLHEREAWSDGEDATARTDRERQSEADFYKTKL